MSCKNLLFRALVVAVALVATSGFAQAAVNTYGTLVGTNVTYLGPGNPPDPLGITEITTTIPGPNAPVLYGPPGIAGDTMTFSPQNFAASASNGTFQLQDGGLRYNIQSNQGSPGIQSVKFDEGGAWTVAGGTGNFAAASLVVNGLFITHVNGSSVNPIAVPLGPNVWSSTIGSGNAANVAVVSTPTGITFNSGGSGSPVTGSWNGSETFNVAAALAAAGINGAVTRVSVSLDNILNADTVTGGVALIDKKFFFNVTTVVPEPSTFVLAGLGCLGLVATSYRRRKAKA